MQAGSGQDRPALLVQVLDGGAAMTAEPMTMVERAELARLKAKYEGGA